MIQQHPSKIIKSDFRKLEKGNSYWSFSSLINSHHSTNELTTFGGVEKFEEITINANEKFEYLASTNQLILIPIIGAIDYKLNSQTAFLHVNQLQTITIEKETKIEFANPYEKELVSFILIECLGTTTNQLIEFDYNRGNTITTLIEYEEIKLSTGLFHAREEGIYKLNTKQNGVFAFVLNGAFEFQNRLLENKDALTIWEIDEIEFEALTQNSLLIIIEN